MPSCRLHFCSHAFNFQGTEQHNNKEKLVNRKKRPVDQQGKENNIRIKSGVKQVPLFTEW